MNFHDFPLAGSLIPGFCPKYRTGRQKQKNKKENVAADRRTIISIPREKKVIASGKSRFSSRDNTRLAAAAAGPECSECTC